MRQQSTNKNFGWHHCLIFITAAIVILILLLGGPSIFYLLASPADDGALARYGQMGDSYGGLNAFFTGLSLIGVVAALILQTRELRSQVEASEAQAEALKEQADTLKVQANTLGKQLELTHRASQFSAYSQVVDEYTQIGIKDDVRELWRFYREKAGQDPRTLERVFGEYLKDEGVSDRSGLDDEELFSRLNKSLDQRRKRIVNFYHKVNTYIDLGMLDKDLFYLGWGENDLRIIPEILFPMQRVVAANSGKEKPAFDDLEAMSLYANRFPEEMQRQRLVWDEK